MNIPISERQIQKKFKHAADFGVSGNYNLQTAAAFAAAIQSHVQKPGVNDHWRYWRWIGMEKYIKLLQEFVGNNIIADEFERRFLQLFKDDNNLHSGREFKILDKLFADVDAYCSDPDLIEDPRFDISEAQLQVSAEETLDKLVNLTRV